MKKINDEASRIRRAARGGKKDNSTSATILNVRKPLHEITKADARKAHYRMCLLHHPDKMSKCIDNKTERKAPREK